MLARRLGTGAGPSLCSHPDAECHGPPTLRRTSPARTPHLWPFFPSLGSLATRRSGTHRAARRDDHLGPARRTVEPYFPTTHEGNAGVERSTGQHAPELTSLCAVQGYVDSLGIADFGTAAARRLVSQARQMLDDPRRQLLEQRQKLATHPDSEEPEILVGRIMAIRDPMALEVSQNVLAFGPNHGSEQVPRTRF